jgi:hypothetical protein
MAHSLPGPWMCATVFTVSVPMASKSNHRRAPRSSEWSRFRAFEDAVAIDARLALPSQWPALDADLGLAKRPVVCLAIAASTLLDATNLPKSVADALQGICYANDASARACSSIALRSSRSHAVVGVAALAPGVSLSALGSASTELLALTVERFEQTLPADPPR